MILQKENYIFNCIGPFFTIRTIPGRFAIAATLAKSGNTLSKFSYEMDEDVFKEEVINTTIEGECNDFYHDQQPLYGSGIALIVFWLYAQDHDENPIPNGKYTITYRTIHPSPEGCVKFLGVSQFYKPMSYGHIGRFNYSYPQKSKYMDYYDVTGFFYTLESEENYDLWY